MSEHAHANQTKLEIQYLEVSDSGEYECSLSNGERSRVLLKVFPVEDVPKVSRRRVGLKSASGRSWSSSSSSGFLSSSVDDRESEENFWTSESYWESEKASAKIIEGQVGKDFEVSCGLNEKRIDWFKKNDDSGDDLVNLMIKNYLFLIAFNHSFSFLFLTI